jgi:hypothetical protein
VAVPDWSWAKFWNKEKEEGERALYTFSVGPEHLNPMQIEFIVCESMLFMTVVSATPTITLCKKNSRCPIHPPIIEAAY